MKDGNDQYGCTALLPFTLQRSEWTESLAERCAAIYTGLWFELERTLNWFHPLHPTGQNWCTGCDGNFGRWIIIDREDAFEGDQYPNLNLNHYITTSVKMLVSTKKARRHSPNASF